MGGALAKGIASLDVSKVLSTLFTHFRNFNPGLTVIFLFYFIYSTVFVQQRGLVRSEINNLDYQFKICSYIWSSVMLNDKSPHRVSLISINFKDSHFTASAPNSFLCFLKGAIKAFNIVCQKLVQLRSRQVR